MGSKKLKAVVVKGSIPIPTTDPDAMKVLRKKYLSVFKEGSSTNCMGKGRII